MENIIKSKDSNKTIGYWAAQEQYSMQDLLDFVIEAEKCGFTTTMTSDHFHPWWHTNGYGNFTWIWMAVAANNTKKMEFVTGVTSSIYRYHPAIIAQAFASLNSLFPGRIGLGIGTGEALNEVPLGYDWPSPKFRLTKTIDSVKVIRKLWSNANPNINANSQKKNCDKNNDFETKSTDSNADTNYTLSKETGNNNGFVNYKGDYFLIREAKLYTPPSSRIPLYMAAIGSNSLKAAAEYSDGLVTFLNPKETKEIKLLEKFNKGVEDAGKNPNLMEKIVEYKVSYSEDYDKALFSANFWRATLIKNVFNSDISDPRKLAKKAKEKVSDKKLKDSIQITTSVEECIKSIEEYFDVGYTRVHVHSTSPDEIKFIHQFCKKVLPYFNNKHTQL